MEENKTGQLIKWFSEHDSLKVYGELKFTLEGTAYTIQDVFNALWLIISLIDDIVDEQQAALDTIRELYPLLPDDLDLFETIAMIEHYNEFEDVQ